MKTIESVEMVCAICGTSYAMEQTLKDLRLKDGNAFFCPNGHPQRYSDSLKDRYTKLTTELQEIKTELQDTQTENRRLKCLVLKQTSTMNWKQHKMYWFLSGLMWGMVIAFAIASFILYIRR
jgi:hypothetical protein